MRDGQFWRQPLHQISVANVLPRRAGFDGSSLLEHDVEGASFDFEEQAPIALVVPPQTDLTTVARALDAVEIASEPFVIEIDASDYGASLVVRDVSGVRSQHRTNPPEVCLGESEFQLAPRACLLVPGIVGGAKHDAHDSPDDSSEMRNPGSRVRIFETTDD